MKVRDVYEAVGRTLSAPHLGHEEVLSVDPWFSPHYWRVYHMGPNGLDYYCFMPPDPGDIQGLIVLQVPIHQGAPS